MSSPVIFVDGSSYLFRAFHALPPLMNSKGQATGAMFGVANMVRRLIKDYSPQKIAVVFDAKGKTFRDDLYPEYKANRPPMPDELSSQFPPLIEILEAMGLPLLIIDGVEADDVIGTLCIQARKQNSDVLVSTSDKDMAQLVCSKINLINTMTGKKLTPEGVKEKFGVWPEQIIDYLALVGDTSDNVPGVPKCGPKTAAKWLNEYKTLDRLIASANDISGKIGINLRQSIDMLPLSKKLVTIKTDVKLPLNVNELSVKEANIDKLIDLCKTFEFKSWLKELLETSKDNNKNSESKYSIINNKDDFTSYLEKLTKAKTFCLDTETTSLNPIDAELVGISFAINPGEAVYIPINHQESGMQLELDWVLKHLKPLLEDASIAKIGQNLKYDRNVLRKYDIKLAGIAFDTMLESYVLDSTASRHDMDTLALKYLGYKTISFKEVAGEGANQLRFDEIPIVKAAEYAAEDADITLQLHQMLYPRLEGDLKKVYEEIEAPLISVLADIEYLGVKIDLEELGSQGKRLKSRINELEQKVINLAGESFNLNSTKQLREILYEKLNLPILSKTPTGQPSTAESVLQELSHTYPLPALILEYRSLSKLVSTYVDALPKKVNPATNRVHTSYNQAVTATGRLSSSDPNLQNIPVRTEEGRLIRQAFIPEKGHVLLAADYSQIELRIMAHLSQDDSLLSAFANGLDIHKATAAEIFSVDLDMVNSEQRRSAKAVNFGLIYGMSAFGLAKQLGIEKKEAQSYIDTYFKRYPKVAQYMEDTRNLAREKGFVETIFGRRLYLPEINSQNHIRKHAAERTAINAPMQGSAADIIKKAMLCIAAWQKKQEKFAAKMIMQVHDELVFEVTKGFEHEAVHEIKKIMEQAVKIDVPLEVTIGLGANWGEAH